MSKGLGVSGGGVKDLGARGDLILANVASVLQQLKLLKLSSVKKYEVLGSALLRLCSNGSAEITRTTGQTDKDLNCPKLCTPKPAKLPKPPKTPDTP